MKVKGTAPVIAMALATETLPETSTPKVIADIRMPQISLVRTSGFRLPLVVIIETTKVPESALVTRKMKTRITARMLRTPVPGR